MIQTAKRLEGIGEYYFSQKLREIDQLNKAGKQIISLGIGSPDLPPHPDVIKVLQEESAHPHVHSYQSYKGSPILRKAISEWYQKWYEVNLNPDSEILPLIGSKEGIMHICMTYLNEGDKALIPNPGYPTYNSAVRLSGAMPLTYQLRAAQDWHPDLNELNALDLTGVKLMFINYPHMPTGQLPIPGKLQQLVDWCNEKKILLVHDNPYSFILNEHPFSLLSLKNAKSTVIELNSLSKSLNMAGWRVGLIAADENHINQILRFKSNMDSGMFLPVQLAAAKALTLDKDWYAGLNEIYAQRRMKVFELLDQLNCSYSTGQAGMFVWAKVNDEKGTDHQLGKGGAMSDTILYEANVFITPGGIFGNAGKDYIRVSLCATEEKISESISRIKRSALPATHISVASS
ncbi:MAG: aminotransferase class I/II-fold pyridoxal phosphate-dependent enzyme [Bacteroidetes bacterium]|nr:aminotransferase class I/II-fold pyridoxal phosphate-dependent enzyme [Bacteroidota bacterium]